MRQKLLYIIKLWGIFYYLIFFIAAIIMNFNLLLFKEKLKIIKKKNIYIYIYNNINNINNINIKGIFLCLYINYINMYKYKIFL